MPGRIVHEPKPHYCRPGWTEYEITDSDIPELNGRIGLAPPDHFPEGAVWECDCGRTWVAYYRDPRCGDLSPHFRREGRWARWRRQRAQRHSPSQSATDLAAYLAATKDVDCVAELTALDSDPNSEH